MTTPAPSPEPAKRSRRIYVYWGIVVVLLVAGGITWWVLTRSEPEGPTAGELDQYAQGLVSGHFGPNHIGPDAHKEFVAGVTRNAEAINLVIGTKYLGIAFDAKWHASLFVDAALECTARGDPKGSLRLARQLAQQLEDGLTQLHQNGPHKAVDFRDKRGLALLRLYHTSLDDDDGRVLLRLKRRRDSARLLVSDLEKQLGLIPPGEQPQ